MIAYKKLGFLLLKESKNNEAKKSFEKYLEFNPPKRDVEMIENIFRKMK